MDREGLNILELLVEQYGLQGVVSGLSYYCGEKSAHIGAHYFDPMLAKRWMGYATLIDKVTAAIDGGRNGDARHHQAAQ
jgi:hypothetical protein